MKFYNRIDEVGRNGAKGIVITSFNNENHEKILLEEDLSLTGGNVDFDKDSFFKGHINNISPEVDDGTIIETIHPHHCYTCLGQAMWHSI